MYQEIRDVSTLKNEATTGKLFVDSRSYRKGNSSRSKSSSRRILKGKNLVVIVSPDQIVLPFAR
jgi:hypothetical protein